MKIIIRTIKELGRMVRQEGFSDLVIPELEKVSRDDMVELVDWELKQVEEQRKLFGVGSWSLLVGLAGVIWATASLPVLGRTDLGGVFWAFFLLESTLVSLRILWVGLTIYPKESEINRAVRTSVVGGAGTKTAVVLGIFQLGLLFVSTLFWNDPVLQGAAYFLRVLLAIGVAGQLALILIFNLDIQMVLKPSKDESPRNSALFINVTLILFTAALPVIGWSWVCVGGKMPTLPDWQVGGLLVAAAYLLRLLLASEAQARHQPFLRQLRRDLVLGFVTPSAAAKQMGWRLSGFPTDLYMKGRLTALTREFTQISDIFLADTERLEAGMSALQQQSGDGEKSKVENASCFLATQLDGQIAGKMEAMAFSRTAFFFAFAKKHIEKTQAFKEWEEAREKTISAGKKYEHAYQRFHELIEQEKKTLLVNVTSQP